MIAPDGVLAMQHPSQLNSHRFPQKRPQYAVGPGAMLSSGQVTAPRASAWFRGWSGQQSLNGSLSAVVDIVRLAILIVNEADAPSSGEMTRPGRAGGNE